jgi:imidazoleglycerol-phosphate dehydratase/histidinol-phosphatase
MSKKYLFIDRDGTMIEEPEDKQIDCLSKLMLKKDLIPALIRLRDAGYTLVMISNQDGLGTESFSQEQFLLPQNMFINVLKTQGIIFESILICPHVEADRCECRKPRMGLVMEYLRREKMDFLRSYVIGDRESDLQLAINMGINAIPFQNNWEKIASDLTSQPRRAEVARVTNETNINVKVDLDQCKKIQIETGLGFFNHMLEQLASHAGMGLILKVTGDIEVDEHHTVEDTALTLGEAIRSALGDKRGINRYGFLLPMDEAEAQVSLDLSGRPYFKFTGEFIRETVGGLPTELIPHFFRSLSETLGAAIHITVTGENAHHMIESIFKAVGRSLRQAIHQQGSVLPSTKGVL